MYVLQRTTDGAFVARPGSGSSYTNKLQNAETFRTAEQADANRCPENERVVAVSTIMKRITQ